MEIYAARQFLLKYAYHSNKLIQEDYRAYITKASDADIMIVYNHYLTYIHRFFIAKNVNEPVDEIRKAYNDLREQFIAITLANFDKKKHNTLIQYYNSLDKMIVGYKHKIDFYKNNTLSEIYSQLTNTIRDNGHWLLKYDIHSLTKIDTLADWKFPINNYYEQQHLLAIIINDEYYVQATTLEDYQVLLAQIKFAYERHLVHGHIVDFALL